MKRILLLGAVLVPVSYSPLFSQIYRAGDFYYTSSPAPAVLENRWEIAVSVSVASSALKEISGASVQHWETAPGARVLYALNSWASVGMEGAVSDSRSGGSLLSEYKSARWGMAVKFTLTPNTAPRTYVLAGAGITRREVEYLGKRQDAASSPYMTFGLGVETDLTDAWFIGLEGGAVYTFDKDIGPYLSLKHRCSALLAARTGIRF